MTYSYLSNKRVYGINEYGGKISELVNEYDEINEYGGKFPKIGKRVYDTQSKNLAVFRL